MQREHGSDGNYFPLSPESIKLFGLHIARFGRSLNSDKHHDIFAYKVFPDKKMVFYSGLNSDGLSTINGAEEILKSLMKDDPSIDPQTYKFFDICTVRCYEYYYEGKSDVAEVKFSKDGNAHFIPNPDRKGWPEETAEIIKILANP